MNLANWQLTDNGVAVNGGIVSVEPTASNCDADNKYEAVITFDGDPTTAGNQPLAAGSYMLTILGSDRRTDLFGNGLDGAYTGTARQQLHPHLHRPQQLGGDGGDGGSGGVHYPSGHSRHRLHRQIPSTPTRPA